MNSKERIVRSITSIILIIFGLILLNHSFYSFWVSSGPPNDYPNLWYQNGIISFSESLASIFLGVLVNFHWQALKSSWLVRVIAFITILGLIYPYAKEFLLIDSCLDQGGHWSNEYFKCQS